MYPMCVCKQNDILTFGVLTKMLQHKKMFTLKFVCFGVIHSHEIKCNEKI